MYRPLRTTLCAVAIAAGAPSAWADSHPQSAPQATQTNSGLNGPLDPRAAAAETTYDSAFTRYRPYKEEEVRSWRAVNEEVGRIGGWQAYAREAAQAQGASATQNDPHAGHTMK